MVNRWAKDMLMLNVECIFICCIWFTGIIFILLYYYNYYILTAVIYRLVLLLWSMDKFCSCDIWQFFTDVIYENVLLLWSTNKTAVIFWQVLLLRSMEKFLLKQVLLLWFVDSISRAKEKNYFNTTQTASVNWRSFSLLILLAAVI